MAREGLVRDVYRQDRNGNLVLVGSQRHPLSISAKEHRAALARYCGELGLGPSARGRLNLPALPDGDVDDLLD